MNYFLIAVVVLFVIFLVVFIIRRNKKDLKALEKQINESEVKPDKHDGPKI